MGLASVRPLLAVMRRNFIVNRRAYQWSFFVGNMITAMYTVALGYFMYVVLFQRQVDASFVRYSGTSDYMTYLILGAGVYTLSVRTMLNVSRSLISERREGTLESLFLTPVSRPGYLLAVMIQQTAVSGGEFLLAMLFAWPFGLNLSHVSWGGVAAAAAATWVGLFGLSILLGVVMLYTRDTYLSQNTLFWVIYLVCGLVFPVQYLPVWVQVISRWIPVTGAVNLLRAAAMAGQGPAQMLPSLLFYGGLSVVYLLTGLALMGWVERVALEEVLS